MSGGQYRRFLLAYGLLPLRKQPYAGMVKLENTQDLGSCAFACGFESHYPHHVGAKPVPCKLRRLKMSRRIFYPCRLPCLSGYVYGLKKQEAQQLLLEVLESGPEWQWDRFIREHIE